MAKMMRILGKRGRTTIPYAIRQSVGFGYNDVLSFTEGDDGRSVIIRREKLCDNCKDKEPPVVEEHSLQDVLSGLSHEEQLAAFLYLANGLATKQPSQHFQMPYEDVK